MKALSEGADVIKGLEEDRLFTSNELKSMMSELMSAGYSEEPYQLMLFTQKLHVRQDSLGRGKASLASFEIEN